MTSLRWYAGLAWLLFGLVPTTMVTLLVARGDTPRTVGLLLIGGIPLIAAALVFALRGMTGTDPDAAARRLRLSMSLVAGADVLLLGGNWLIRATGS